MRVLGGIFHHRVSIKAFSISRHVPPGLVPVGLRICFMLIRVNCVFFCKVMGFNTP